MGSDIANLRGEINRLQKTLNELEDAEAERHSSKDKGGKPVVDAATLDAHRAERSPTIPYILNLPIGAHMSAPFVYGMVVPIVFLDVCLFIYQAVCFRLWNIQRVRRGAYVVIDRHHLAYLNGMEKLNCVYCGYANGIFAFAQEIAARTEHFWCPIKHATRVAQPHSHYDEFTAFGDAEAWKKHPSRKKLKD
jgi:hypothetical protein